MIDAPESAAPGVELTARGAAIRGIGNFASATTFALRRTEDGDLEPDWDSVREFCRAPEARESVLVFGFTFIVWSRFLEAADREGYRFDVPSPRR